MNPKKENIFQLIARMFRESFIEPFSKDNRVRMRWSEKQDFIRQVKTLERSAINNATK